MRGAANSSMAIGDALRVDDIDYGSAPVGTSELRTVPANDSTAGRHLSSPQAVAFTLAELGLASNASTVVGIVILDAAGLDLTFVGLVDSSPRCPTILSSGSASYRHQRYDNNSGSISVDDGKHGKHCRHGKHGKHGCGTGRATVGEHESSWRFDGSCCRRCWISSGGRRRRPLVGDWIGYDCMQAATACHSRSPNRATRVAKRAHRVWFLCATAMPIRRHN